MPHPCHKQAVRAVMVGVHLKECLPLAETRDGNPMRFEAGGKWVGCEFWVCCKELLSNALILLGHDATRGIHKDPTWGYDVGILLQHLKLLACMASKCLWGDAPFDGRQAPYGAESGTGGVYKNDIGFEWTSVVALR